MLYAGLDFSKVTCAGPNGRVVKDDILAEIEAKNESADESKVEEKKKESVGTSSAVGFKDEVIGSKEWIF